MSRWRSSASALGVVALLCALLASGGASSETPIERSSSWRTVGKVHPELYQVEAESGRARAAERNVRYRPDGQPAPSFVTIAAVPTGTGPDLLADLEQLGLQRGAAIEKMVTGRLPVHAIHAAGELDSLQFLRPEWAVRSAGRAVSEGDRALKADVARADFAVDGTGVTIGTLSDSFDCTNGYATDKAEGEFPTDVVVLPGSEGPCAESLGPPSDEGRAMMQIIADVAPNANQIFHSAANGQLDYAQGILDLKDAGAKVINDDFAYINEPWFQDGVIAQAVDDVTAAGVSYFAAAGNSGRLGYQSGYRETTFTPKDLAPATVHDFDPGAGSDPTQRLTVPGQSFVRIGLQWDDHFKTQTPSAPAPRTEMGIYAFAPDGGLLPVPGLPGTDPTKLFAIPGDTPQATALEPVELMVIINPERSAQPVDLVIPRFSGPEPSVLKWIAVTSSEVTIDEYATPDAGTIFGHTQALGAMAVGAASALQTSTPPVIESYSSLGGSQVFRDQRGERIGAGAVRERPNFVGPDEVSTSFFPSEGEDPDGDGYPNFPGTSAAAPHAAAVAALALQEVPTATRDDICNALSTTAVDMATPGVDAESGHGHIDVGAALTELTAAVKKQPSDRCKTATVTVDSVTKEEGASGMTVFTFKLTKLGRTASDLAVEYATSDGTAKETTDYEKTTGVVTFTPADVSQTVDVAVIGDGEVESDEMFDLTIRLKDPAPAAVALTNSFGTATITDDDDPTRKAEPAAKNYVTWGEASPNSGSPGDELKISGLGFKPNTELVGTFHSTPVELGRITSNATGSFAAVATIPSVESGRHHIEVTGENAEGGTRTIRYPVTVINGVSPVVGGTSPGGTSVGANVTTGSAPTVIQGGITPTTAVTGTPTTSPTSLPNTGANVTFFAQLGVLLIFVGLAATYGSRKRRRAGASR